VFRSCDDCYRDFRLWDKKRLSRRDDAGVVVAAAAAAAVGTERTTSADGTVGSSSKALDVAQIGGKKGIMGTIAQSVPRDWAWSTF
jgi:hypothetical protein